MLRAFAAALLVACPTLSAHAAVRIDVNDEYIVYEVQPELRQYSNTGGTSFVLNDGGKVTLVSTGGTSTNDVNGYVTGVNRTGVSGIVNFRISHNSITQYYQNQYIREATVIRIKQDNFCEVTVKARMPAGQYFIIGLNPTKSISHQDAINVVCKFRKIP